MKMKMLSLAVTNEMVPTMSLLSVLWQEAGKKRERELKMIKKRRKEGDEVVRVEETEKEISLKG